MVSRAPPGGFSRDAAGIARQKSVTMAIAQPGAMVLAAQAAVGASREREVQNEKARRSTGLSLDSTMPTRPLRYLLPRPLRLRPRSLRLCLLQSFSGADPFAGGLRSLSAILSR
jgi:hypothetical protein